MNKKLILSEEHFKVEKSSIDAGLDPIRTMPEHYPCVIVYCEISNPNGRDFLEYEYIYKDYDFEPSWKEMLKDTKAVLAPKLKNGVTFKAFEVEVRKQLSTEQNEWWDSEDAHGCWDAEWSVSETLLQIASAWDEFCRFGKQDRRAVPEE